ncbi:MAG: HlyD family efflux transporter periplasmic adaptor subunit, partial [Lautropia sp.]
GRGDGDYLRDLNEALEAQATPTSTAMIYLMGLLITVAIGWAAFATVEEVTRAEARVVPAGREQVISSLEGGVLAELLVAEGDVVAKDQPLARLDGTRFGSQVEEGQARALALKGTIARLKAEANGGNPRYPSDVAAVRRIVRNENAAFESRRRVLRESQAALRRSLGLVNAEIASARRLAAKGLYSEVELGRLKRQANELEMQIDERGNKFRADAAADLARLEGELAQLAPLLTARRDTFDRTVLRAPIRGVVKNIRAGTIGGSVQPGAAIMELIPLDGDLLLEARLKPSDVGFVRTGLSATVKITAYDYSVFGDMRGVVRSIGPDTMRDDPRTAQQPDSAWYRVIVATDRPALRVGDKDLPIIPGMTGSVEIRTGEKTVLDFLLKPMFKAKEAFRER